MQPLRELISKIRFGGETPSDYVFYYEDRKLNKLLELKFTDITRAENIFLVVMREKETYIPMHRVREVRKKGIVVWKR
ncbi:DUF504 domain-containing protein [Candidatus Woesearchaeota archaeon]|nr:DUF504 domain-containing protein [Candidatus Woesearchaeota archaeon]